MAHSPTSMEIDMEQIARTDPNLVTPDMIAINNNKKSLDSKKKLSLPRTIARKEMSQELLPSRRSHEDSLPASSPKMVFDKQSDYTTEPGFVADLQIDTKGNKNLH